ncbi:hypothetical protein [Acinetobacter sp. Ver3]|uniref:hypothetical protein n=1 Tax=Acinetobacter sp. Ver3 TaxID=466088 RepID=UPI00044F04DF|nr:hypothetical protein [Acinetobacter sp. Ver3]EZQ10789.1 hypothetical protein CL42_06510 [Acinetobacter sp. Ver3]
MNLIEQLGGYDKALKAKEWLVKNRPVHDWMNPILDEALLKYRRQHNIFEEKDNIVFVDDFMHGELMAVAWVRNSEVWMDDGAKRCTNLTMIRHATPEEIQANKRLEVL